MKLQVFHAYKQQIQDGRSDCTDTPGAKTPVAVLSWQKRVENFIKASINLASVWGHDANRFCAENFISVRAMRHAEVARDSLKVIMESIGLQMLSTDFQAGRTRGEILNDVSRMSRRPSI